MKEKTRRRETTRKIELGLGDGRRAVLCGDLERRSVCSRENSIRG